MASSDGLPTPWGPADRLGRSSSTEGIFSVKIAENITSKRKCHNWLSVANETDVATCIPN